MRAVFLREQPEYMGIFGFSWQEKVAAAMKQYLSGTDIVAKLSSFWQAGGLNVSIVNNLYNEYGAYMARGYSPATFSSLPDANGNGGSFDSATKKLSNTLQANTNLDPRIVDAFLRALYVCSRDGKIPFAKWNPAGYQISEALRKTFSSEQSVLDKAVSASTNVGTNAKIILIVAGLGTAAYLVYKFKGKNAD